MSATAYQYPVSELDEIVERISPVWESLQSASLFITGGTGFFGKWLLALLLRANDQRDLDLHITALTRDAAFFRQMAPELADASAVNLLEGDVRNFSYPNGRFTHIIHAATSSNSTVMAKRNPIGLADIITQGTRRVLDFAALRGGARVLFVSSGATYGSQPEGMEKLSEDYLGVPSYGDVRTIYGQCKRFAELMVEMFNTQHGLESTVARCFTFVGPGMPLSTNLAIGRFIKSAINGNPIQINGDGTPLRSYLYAADLAGWLLSILTRGEPGRIYNVGASEIVSIRELAELVCSVLDADVDITVAREDEGGWRNRYVPDISRAEKELGLRQWTDLKDSIRRTAAWAKVALRSDIRHMLR